MICEKKIINGMPEIVIDGTPVSRTVARLAEPGTLSVEKLRQYDKADIRLFFTSMDMISHFGWDGRDRYDYGHYEYHIRRILDVRPDIKLLLWVGNRYGTPYFWLKDHPGHAVRKEMGVEMRTASFASDAWKRDSVDAVQRFVEHFENSPFADAIAGYNPIYINNEWLTCLDHEGFADFSEFNLLGFRNWLAERYRDDSDLREAWRDPNVSLEDAAIPGTDLRTAHGRKNMFVFPEDIGESVADYYRYYNKTIVDFMLAWFAAIKSTCGCRKLTGMMGMYGFGHMGFLNMGCQTGHMDVHRLLASADIDYLHGPYDYNNRCFGGTHRTSHVTDAILLYGKVFLTQIDTKTHVHPPPNTNARTPWETENILKRDVGFALSKRCYHYFYEMAVTAFRGMNRPSEYRRLTYDTPEIRKEIALLQRVCDEARETAPANNTEIALIFGLEGEYYRCPNLKGAYNLYGQALRQYFLPYIAAPFDEYYLEDFKKLDRPYKLYIFANTAHVSGALREKIRRKLSADGATAVWHYAPGYITDNGRSALDNCRALTGIQLGADHRLLDFAQVKITDFSHALTQKLDFCTEYGADIEPSWFQEKQEWLAWVAAEKDEHRISPIFFADDPDARTLGVLTANGRDGLALKDGGGFTSIYSAAPLLHVPLLSSILDHASVHRYSDRDDMIYANSNYVIFQANGDGTRNLLLPVSSTIHNAITGEKLATNTSSLELHMRHGEVRYFKV